MHDTSSAFPLCIREQQVKGMAFSRCWLARLASHAGPGAGVKGLQCGLYRGVHVCRLRCHNIGHHVNSARIHGIHCFAAMRIEILAVSSDERLQSEKQ